MKNLTTAFLIIIALSGCKQHQDPKPKPLPEPVVSYSLDSFDILTMLYVSGERTKAGIPGPLLELNTEVGDVCATHSLYMSLKDTPSHDFFTRRAEQFPNHYVGEVVAYNYREPASVAAAWMNSEAHRKIILDPKFTQFACSHHKNAQGKIYVEMMLIGPKSHNKKPVPAGT